MSEFICEECGKPQKVVITPKEDLVHEDVTYAKSKLCQPCYNKIMREKQAEVEAIIAEGKTEAEAVAIVKEGKPLAVAIAIIKEEKPPAEAELEAELEPVEKSELK